VADELETEALRAEVDRLRTENASLRTHLGIEVPVEEPVVDPRRPQRVLLHGDPAAPKEPGRPGGAAVANLARLGVQFMVEREPGCEWRPEHDLSRIDEEAVCFQLGEVLTCLWDGSGPPRAYRVSADDEGRRSLRRAIVSGEAESERFLAGYRALLAGVDELLAEAEAASEAGAGHHATWAFLAVRVRLAEARLALVLFEGDSDEWREHVGEPRPEYEPRNVVAADLPVGF
jgi:hypothetical protein